MDIEDLLARLQAASTSFAAATASISSQSETDSDITSSLGNSLDPAVSSPPPPSGVLISPLTGFIPMSPQVQIASNGSVSLTSTPAVPSRHPSESSSPLSSPLFSAALSFFDRFPSRSPDRTAQPSGLSNSILTTVSSLSSSSGSAPPPAIPDQLWIQ